MWFHTVVQLLSCLNCNLNCPRAPSAELGRQWTEASVEELFVFPHYSACVNSCRSAWLKLVNWQSFFVERLWKEVKILFINSVVNPGWHDSSKYNVCTVMSWKCLLLPWLFSSIQLFFVFVNSRLLTLSQSGCGYICTCKVISHVVGQVVVSLGLLGGCCRQQLINSACVKCEAHLNAKAWLNCWSHQGYLRGLHCCWREEILFLGFF